MTVRGSDADLAALARRQPGARVRFEPDADSDLARSVGLRPDVPAPAGAPSTELPLDVLEVHALGDEGVVAVNAVVLGAPPAQLRWATLSTALHVEVDGRVVFDGRATTVVVASGQYLAGADVVPRGHPGDGRAEVQVYALPRGQRRAMRSRLATGAQVPHPGITESSGRTIVVRAPARVPIIVDGRPLGTAEEVRLAVRPGGVVLVL